MQSVVTWKSTIML